MRDPLQDGISSIELIDYMGTDLTPVNSARVSMDVWHEEFEAKDEGLLNFLARNKHISPFFHAILQFRIKMPVFTARQHFKHVVGVARNEVSRRYVKTEPQLWLPEYWRKGSKDIKQGSIDEPHEMSEIEMKKVKGIYDLILAQYNHMIEIGIAPEQARTIIPQSMYTEFIETGSLFYYARYFELRKKPDAQKEIRKYANSFDSIIKKMFPIAWEELTKERKDLKVRLTEEEMEGGYMIIHCFVGDFHVSSAMKFKTGPFKVQKHFGKKNENKADSKEEAKGKLKEYADEFINMVTR